MHSSIKHPIKPLGLVLARRAAFRVQSHNAQRGQAMIEYAIILILMVTLIVGGLELSTAALASSKTTDAAKAGANEFATAYQVVKQNFYDPQKEYLSKLAALGITNIDAGSTPECSSAPLVDTYTDYLAFIRGDESDADLQACLNTDFSTFDTNSNTTVEQSEVNVAADSVAKFKAIIILREIALLSRTSPYLADHDPATNIGLVRPSCNAGSNTYDYGLPDRYPSVGLGSKVYLFNPLPIDLASCAGTDPTRGDKARISILVGGYGKPGDPNYEQGLPALNQAMYGQYTKVCLNASDEYVSCNSTHTQALLKPPGKLCMSNTASNTKDSCAPDVVTPYTPPIGGNAGTGYYFWGMGNVAAKFEYTPEYATNISFRPTFQIVCNGSQGTDPRVMVFDISIDECSNATTVRVITRYRAVFESFLTFGLQELTDASLAYHFFDPSNLRGLGTNLGVAIAGSELGSKASNGNPTVKQFKDFKGCYEVDVETGQVSACS